MKAPAVKGDRTDRGGWWLVFGGLGLALTGVAGLLVWAVVERAVWVF